MSRKRIFANRKEPFIRLECGPQFILHWIGGPAIPNSEKISIGKTKLSTYISYYFSRFVFPAQEKLNGLFKKITGDQKSKVDRKILGEFLKEAKLKMKWAEKIRPFMDLYKKLPENLLYIRVIHPIEEMYLRCLIMVVMFGNQKEKNEALKFICYDFVHMGGITKDRDYYAVMHNEQLWCRYCFDPFEQGQVISEAYQAYGNIVEAIAQEISHNYPVMNALLADSIEFRVSSTTKGFGQKDIKSPAKKELLRKLVAIVLDLKSEAA